MTGRGLICGWQNSCEHFNAFFSNGLINTASFEVGRVYLRTERAFSWTSWVLCAVLRAMISTAFDASGFMVTVIVGMAIGLTIVALWWTTTGQMRFFDYNFGIKYRSNIENIIVVVLTIKINKK